MKVPSLWAGRTARKSRMTLMVTASVLVHTVIISMGSMWRPPEPLPVFKVPETKITLEELPGENGGSSQPAPPQSTPTVTTLADQIEPMVTPTRIEPSDVPVPAVTPRAVRAPVRSMRTTSVTSHTGPVGVPTTAVSVGTGNGPSSAIGIGRGRAGWFTPRPPYPARAQQMRLQGSTTVRFTTDALGDVAEVVIVKSAGNILLDSATQSYVRTHWKGPANSTHTTEFVYQMP